MCIDGIFCANVLLLFVCLFVSSYKEGLLALNGLINLCEGSEAEILEMFGPDVGVAFLLMGRLKSKLQHREGARMCYRLALKYNPFLWTAFEALCEIEGSNVTSLNVREYFKVSEYPSFLRPNPLAPPIWAHTLTMMQTGQPGSATAAGVQDKIAVSETNKTETNQDELNLVCSESGTLSTKEILNSAHHQSGRVVSSTTPKKLKQLFMTPDLFHNPSVGQAIASSTPSVPKNLAVRERIHPSSLGLWSEGVGVARETPELSQPVMGPIKLALDFGSTASKGSGHVLSQGTTPLHPRSVRVRKN